MAKKRNLLIIPIIIILAIVLILLKKDYLTILNVDLFSNELYNRELAYQIETLAVSFIALLISYLFAPQNCKNFFGKGNLDAPVQPAQYFGINPQEDENWLHIGRNFTVIISLVTAIVIIFQVVNTSQVEFDITMVILVLIFALSNSFVEEIIFRFTLVVVLFEEVPPDYIYFLSGLIFGVGHYFGVPGGIPGVLMAGFIGWFLAKSILETKGIFWAWLIHFIQDLIIFWGLFISIL